MSYKIPDNLEATLAEYERLRPLRIRLHTQIGKLPKNETILACAKRLGMLSKEGGRKVVTFVEEYESEIFQDYLIYMYRPRGVSFVQQMLRLNRYSQGGDEQRLLEGMVKARFSIFWIKEIVSTAGVVVVDLASDEEFFILDQTLPQHKVTGMLSGMRIFRYQDVWMHTGANLTLGWEYGSIESLRELLKLEEMSELELNEGAIFKWRKMVESRD
jgi:hypothetical protein